MNLDDLDAQLRHIAETCPGWSGPEHFAFFHQIIRDFRIHDVLVCGVYMGRDIAGMAAIFEFLGIEKYNIVGVDTFSETPGADWDLEDRNKTWEEVVGMPAPDLESAQSNLEKLKLSSNVKLIKQEDLDFLKTTNESFDFIYLDTSHDFKTVYSSIQAAQQRLSGPGLIGGDDYEIDNEAQPEKWGVRLAVEKSFIDHNNHNRLWLSKAQNYR